MDLSTKDITRFTTRAVKWMLSRNRRRFPDAGRHFRRHVERSFLRPDQLLPESYLVALVFLDRVCRDRSFDITDRRAYRAWSTCLCLADAAIDDMNDHGDTEWRLRLFQNNISPKEWRNCKRVVLRLLDYRLQVDRHDVTALLSKVAADKF